MMKHFFLLLFFSPAFLAAQAMLSPDEAVQIGLKNNYDILVARNDAKADSILNKPGEAGMLPTLSINGSVALNRNNIHQKYSNGNDIISNNVGGNTIAFGPVLSWTLFDGTKMFVTKEKLEQIQVLGEYNFKSQVLNSTVDILLGYYDIVRQKQQLGATDTIIKYNEERVKITEARFNSGLGPKTDLLQAKIDLNVQKENRINQQLLLADAKRKLNTLLARDVNIVFEVSDTIPLSPLADRAQIEQKMYASNPVLLAFKAQTEINRLSIREAQSLYSPKVTLNAAYNFNHVENSAGFSLYNQSLGWQTGLTFSIPLYQGGRVNHQVAVAKLDYQSSQFRLQQASLEASLNLQSALAVYDARVQALELERENESMSRENMKLALERLRLGQATALEVEQAQTTLANTLFRYSGFQYDLKSAEMGVHLQAADL